MKNPSVAKVKISVVSPVYGCADCLFELCQRLEETLRMVSSEYEIILVNDASKDGSWGNICELSFDNNKIKGINLSRNFGQHYAISAGLDVAEGDWVVVMDCDLQDRPEDVIKLYEKAVEGYEIVYARDSDNRNGRWTSRECSRVKRAGTWLIHGTWSMRVFTDSRWIGRSPRGVR